MIIEKQDSITHSITLVIGQLLSAASVIFWNNEGRHTITAAVLTILAMVFWSYGFVGLFSLFKEKSPWYARVGLLYAFYGCLGGIAFGFEGLYSTIFNVSDKIGVAAYNQYPLAMNLVLFWAGPAFPLTLLVFGIMFMVKRIGPWWIGLLLSLGGLAFPLSRISRIDYIAHMADLLLLIPLVLIAVEFLRGGSWLKSHKPAF
jgi:hypothetical protein